MCHKTLLRYRDSTCCLGFQTFRYCQAVLHGYHCMGPQIVGVKETDIEKPTSHTNVECDATLFCRMRVPGDRVQSHRGDFDLVLRGLEVQPAEEVFRRRKVVMFVKMPECWGRRRGGIHNWHKLPNYHDMLDRALGFVETREQTFRNKFKTQAMVHLSDIAGSKRGLLNWHLLPTPEPQTDDEDSRTPVESIWDDLDEDEEITFSREPSVEAPDPYGVYSVTREEIAAAREEMEVVWEEMAAAQRERLAAREEMAAAREGSVTSEDAFGYSDDEVEEEIIVAQEDSGASSGASGHSSGDEEEGSRETSLSAGGKSSPGASGEDGDASDDSSALSELSDGDFMDLTFENFERLGDSETEDEASPATPYYVESEAEKGRGTGRGRKRPASEVEWTDDDEPLANRKRSKAAEPEVDTDDDEPLSYRWRK